MVMINYSKKENPAIILYCLHKSLFPALCKIIFCRFTCIKYSIDLTAYYIYIYIYIYIWSLCTIPMQTKFCLCTTNVESTYMWQICRTSKTFHFSTLHCDLEVVLIFGMQFIHDTQLSVSNLHCESPNKKRSIN